MLKISGKKGARSLLSALTFAAVLVFSGTGCNDPEPVTDPITDVLEIEIDSTASTLLKFNNTLFSLPSPYQIAYLAKDLGIDYNKEFLNPINRQLNYTDHYKKALNLGVYGADLGYLNIYEQTPDAISYFSVVKMLSQDLDISGAFDANIVSRIENNMGNKDSLMYIISNAYRNVDKYLEDNNRNDIAALVLTGGWVESLHIITQIYQDEKRQELMNRIGEQQHPLDNLIKILSPYYNESDQYAALVDDLIDLAYIFDAIDIEYTYIEPEVVPEEKLTIINSKTNLKFTDDQIKMISEKVAQIRNSIIE